jgi:hypothetical protein
MIGQLVHISESRRRAGSVEQRNAVHDALPVFLRRHKIAHHAGEGSYTRYCGHHEVVHLSTLVIEYETALAKTPQPNLAAQWDTVELRG